MLVLQQILFRRCSLKEQELGDMTGGRQSEYEYVSSRRVPQTNSKLGNPISFSPEDLDNPFLTHQVGRPDDDKIRSLRF